MKKIIALAALAVISAGASASTNLFSDGSFEALSTGGGWAINTSSVPSGLLSDGWTVGLAPSTSAAGLPVGLEVRQSGVVGTAQDGSKFIELDGNQNDKISQELATKVHQAYEITFYYADRADESAATAKVTGGFAYSLQGTTAKYSKVSFGQDWNELVIDFTAVSSETNFSIWALGKSDGYGTSFDNFSALAVPEPGMLGLFAAGLAVLGLTARRRQQ
jgi:hypothetical protein